VSLSTATTSKLSSKQLHGVDHLPPLSPTYDTEEALSDFDSQSSPESRNTESSNLVKKQFWTSSMKYDTENDCSPTGEGQFSSNLKQNDPEIIFLLT
jgi:hypothetical protein